MFNHRKLAFMLLGLLILLPATAGADLITLTPSQATLIPDDAEGRTRVVFTFNLSALATIDPIHVDSAILDWEVAGIPSNTYTEHTLHRVTEVWTVGGAATTAPAYAATESDLWEFSPRDYANNGGGLVRFDMTGLVADWLDETAVNFGVVLVTDALDGDDLDSHWEDAVLTVRFAGIE